MIVFGNLLIGIAGVLHWVVVVFYWLLIARCILSFVDPDPRNPIVQFIYNTTEPLLGRVRDKIPPLGMFDLSALVVLVALYFVDAFLVQTLHDYGMAYRYKSGATYPPTSL